MLLPFTGSALSWSHLGHVLVVDVHAPSGPLSHPDGPLVEWEALARYLGSGADDARALLVTGDRGLDAGLCWSSLSDQVETAWSGLPAFVSGFATAGRLTELVDRVTAVARAIRDFERPSAAVVAGSCARGGLEVAAATGRIIAERDRGTEAQLRSAGVAVDRWVAPGEGAVVGLGTLGLRQVPAVSGSAHTPRQST